jgi:2-(1,2-epoxy-1,2-dihydrophenyl)acetyl-CoA isomerase
MNNKVMYSVENQVATIAINRPEVKNAIDKETHEELYEAFSTAKKDENVKVIVFTGSGDSFSSGADLKSIPTEELGTFDYGFYLDETYNRLLLLMEEIEKPIVAYINGMAVGAGLSLALACDFRFADRNATFALSFLKIGLVPDAGASYYLPRLVGLSKALELGTGVKIDVEKALQIGLINGHGYPDTWIDQLTMAPLPAYGMMKRNMRRGFEDSLEDVLAYEVEGQREAGKSQAHQDALQAFLQKSQKK